MSSRRRVSTGQLVFRLLVVVSIVGLLVVVNFSFPLADWWGRNVHLAGRPATGELDVHIVLWLVIGIVALMVYGVVIARYAPSIIGSWSGLAQTAVYVVLGLIWLLPLKRFLIWMETGRWSPPE